MNKKIFQILLAIVTSAVILFFCSNPQNPFSNPENAKIALFFQDSKGIVHSDQTVIDTVGNTIRIGVCPYLYNLIDSVVVTILKYRNSTDSILVFKKFSSDIDTLWNSFSFTTIGKWDITAKAISNGGKVYTITGEIKISGKIVSAAIQPQAETKPVDSVAVFTILTTADTPLTYQWYHDTTVLAGETGASLIKSHVAFSDSGKYTCLVRDKWGDSGLTAIPAILTVTPKVIIKTNTKPVISVSGHSAMLASEICSLTVSATDPDSGQTHVFAVAKAPTGYSFTGNLFIWQPPAGYLGTDTIKSDTAIFTVTDNGQPPLSDTEKVAIVVSTKIPPPDSVKGIAAVSRINGSFVFKWNTSKNADQYAVFRGKDTSSFAQYSTTKDTSFTNAIRDTVFYYYVIATNSKGQSAASQRVRSTIINTPPTWAHNAISISVNEGSSVSFNCSDSCKDTNGDDISFQLVSSGGVNDSLVGTVWRYSPSYTDSGSYSVKIKAWDGMDSSILTIALHVVNVPRLPQPQPQNLSTNRNTALQITLTAIDPDGDAITSWTIDTPTTHGSTTIGSSAQPNITYTPAIGFIGTDYFTFKASVGSLMSAYSAKVTIKVDTTNFAPVILQKLSAITKNKGDSLILTITINQDAFPAPWYYWYKAGTLLDSTQINFWKKAALALADSGYYYVIVKNVAGHDSCGAKLTMQNAPVISPKLPATTTVNANSTAPITISVNSDATPIPAAQWYFNGTVITGAATNSYSKTWVITDTGTYMVVVSNTAGKDSSFTKLIVSLPPNAPTLVFPADGALGLPVSLTLIWSKIAGASAYYLQVATDTAFGTLFAIDSTLTDTTKLVSGLSNNTTYYWRVRAKNSVGASPWPLKKSFSTIIAAPAVPVLSTPADNAINVALAPTLTWNTVTSAASYRVQISTVNTFATFFTQDSTLASGSKAISGLSISTKYYWRVNATNVGGTSPWAMDSFTTVMAAPAAPVLTAPADNAANVAVNPTLTWSTVSGAALYRVQVSTSNIFTTTIIDYSGSTATKSISGLSNSTKYYWRVLASNAGGISSWATDSFTTIIAAPPTPVLIAPTDNATNVALAPTLTWNASTGAASYHVQVSTSISFASTVVDSSLAGLSKAISGLSNSTKYYWRVNATNVGGTGAWATDSFTTIIATPMAPVLTAPSDNAANVAVAPTLTWNASTGAASYHVQVSTGISFASTAVDSTLAGLSKAISGLSNSTKYYWRVNATNAGGTSAWATDRFTTIVATPVAPALTAPADNAANVAVAPTLTWNASTGAASYHVQVSTSISFASTAVDSTLAGLSKAISGLSNSTKYYWRVNATNVGGTGAWATDSFTTVGDVSDTDGNVYQYITIGTQTWMAENLKTTRYNDGSAITLDTNTTTWGSLTTEAYCWYNNDSITNRNTYGALYNWYAVNTGKLAPKGWHVPSDSEWEVLGNYLGGDAVAGGPLKEAGTLHWASPNTGATNTTGFSARPGGWRSNIGAFSTIGDGGGWWSSTAYDASDSWYRYMSYNGVSVGRYNYYHIDGFSVRCLRDH